MYNKKASDNRPKPMILVVDDVPKNIQLLGNILRNNNYQISFAANGQQALEMMNDITPDLVLLDIMMPGENGYEICKKLKSDESTVEIPIIFISALDDMVDMDRAFSVGGVDYITKPFSSVEILARIDTHLNLVNLQRQMAEKNKQLQKALDEIETLKGLIPE